MKKLLTIALVLVLCMSLSITAFAATITPASEGATITGNNTDTANVLATYEYRTATVYSVDVAWGALTYTYTVNDGTWDPATLSYSGASAEWAATNPNTSDAVTVTNKSNSGVRAAITSELTQAGEGLTLGYKAGTQNMPHIRYYGEDYVLITAAGQSGLIAMDIAAAAPAAGENLGTAYAGNFTVTVEGTPVILENIDVNTTIANLTITISTEGWE